MRKKFTSTSKFRSLKGIYQKQREAAKIEHQKLQSIVITEKHLSGLPQAIQQHLRVTKQIGKPLVTGADVIWRISSLTQDIGKSPKEMATRQFVTFAPITRCMHMKIKGTPFQKA